MVGGLILPWIILAIYAAEPEVARIAMTVVGGIAVTLGNRLVSGRPLPVFRRQESSDLPTVLDILADWLSGIRDLMSILSPLAKKFWRLFMGRD